MAGNLRRRASTGKRCLPHAFHRITSCRHKPRCGRTCPWPGCGSCAALAAFLLVLAGSAPAAPRLERERCTFKPPRGDRVECFVLIVPENREQPQGREVRLKVADPQGQAHVRRRARWSISRAVPAMRRWSPRRPAPMPGSEGDWWNETANDPPPPRRHHHEPARRAAARRPISTASTRAPRSPPRRAAAPSPSSRSATSW